MKRYGDLYTKMDSDANIAAQIQEAIIALESIEAENKVYLDNVLSHIEASEKGKKSLSFMQESCFYIDGQNNDYFFKAFNKEIDWIQSSMDIFKSEDEFYKNIADNMSYITPYITDVLNALNFNFHYEHITENDAVMIQDYYADTVDEVNSTDKYIMPFAVKCEVTGERRFVFSPLENTSSFCQYTWRVLYKDRSSLKCFDVKTDNSNNQRTLRNIIETLSINPRYLFRNISIMDEDIQWLSDFFELRERKDNKKTVTKELSNKVRMFIIDPSSVDVNVDAFISGFSREDLIKSLHIDKSGQDGKNIEISNEDIKQAAIKQVRRYLVRYNLEDSLVLATRDDVWLIEKIFGCKTILAFYPILNIEKSSISLELYKDIFEEIIKCRPLFIRIQLAKIVAYFLQELLYSKDNKNFSSASSIEVYDTDQTKRLKTELSTLISDINRRYLTILTTLYNALNANEVVGYARPTDIWMPYEDTLKKLIDAEDIKEMEKICRSYAVNKFMGKEYLIVKNQQSGEYLQPSSKKHMMASSSYGFAFLETIALRTSYNQYH